MEAILEAAVCGLGVVFSWPNVLYPVAGTILAMTFSFVPGVSGVTLMAIVIPLTFAWEPVPILLLFGALVGGGTFMGSVTAVLFNVPGSAPNAATILDGHPMAREGRAKTALACAATASALGSTCGILVLIALLPAVRRAILAFGPPEFLMLAIWGLVTIAVVTRDAPGKGLVMAGLGLMISFIGLDPRTAELRYTFGLPALRDGLKLVPIFLGVFALAEMIDLAASGRKTISGKSRVEELTGSIREGIASVFRNFGLFLRSSVIGTLVGIIPGIGGTVASFVAYGHAAQSSPDPKRFGEGDVRGVLAPEAANDAKDGGSLVPVFAFGIPGSEGTALLLGALVLHGITPGRELMADRLDLVFVLIWSLFLSNWMTSILGLGVAPRLAKVTLLPTQRFVPVIVALVAFSALVYRGRFSDLVVTGAFGLFGYFLKRYGWPRVPLVIALVLGTLFERNLHLTMRLHELGRIDFWTRPIVLVLIALTIVTFVLPALSRSRGKA